jgi:chromosome segregation ATPase
MGRLENIESDVESREAQIEQEAEEVERNVEELDNKISELSAAVAALSEDQEVAATIQGNLAEREAERDQEKQRASQLESELEELSGELDDFSAINENSKAELSTLQSAGEDVGEALGIVSERDSWVNGKKAELESLKSKLAGIG